MLHACKDSQVRADPQEEDPSQEGNWTAETKDLPKHFSYISIVEHARKSGRNSASSIEKPLEKGYKFFYENYCHDLFCLVIQNQSRESVTGPKERVIDLTMFLLNFQLLEM